MRSIRKTVPWVASSSIRVKKQQYLTCLAVARAVTRGEGSGRVARLVGRFPDLTVNVKFQKAYLSQMEEEL